MTPLTFALTVSTLLSTGGVSPFPTGSDLLRACSEAVRQADGESLNAEQLVKSTWCAGYVSGILDGLALMNWKGGATKVCLPRDGIESQQGIRIVVKYLREHPESLHESGRALMITALGTAFRCK